MSRDRKNNYHNKRLELKTRILETKKLLLELQLELLELEKKDDHKETTEDND